MTPENMKNSLAAQGFLCPLCSNKGKAVKRITIESLLTDEAKIRTPSREGFRFCPSATCDVSYFHPETGERFLCRDVRVRIGQKQTQAPRPICYCFNHSIEEIEAEVAKTGTSKIPDTIMEKCRKGLGRCEQTNPQGSCCIGNVRKALKDAQSRFAKSKSIRIESNQESNADSTQQIDDCCANQTPMEQVTAEQAGIVHNQKSGYKKSIFAIVPSIGVVLLPGLSCPACWPAYAGLLSALGIGFVNYTPYLLPITVLFLITAVFILAFRAKRRRGYRPAFTGLMAAIVIIVGKFVLSLGLLTYSGIGLLVIASIWNSWPIKNKGNLPCSFCVPAGKIAKDKLIQQE